MLGRLFVGSPSFRSEQVLLSRFCDLYWARLVVSSLHDDVSCYCLCLSFIFKLPIDNSFALNYGHEVNVCLDWHSTIPPITLKFHLPHGTNSIGITGLTTQYSLKCWNVPSTQCTRVMKSAEHLLGCCSVCLVNIGKESNWSVLWWRKKWCGRIWTTKKWKVASWYLKNCKTCRVGFQYSSTAITVDITTTNGNVGCCRTVMVPVGQLPSLWRSESAQISAL